MCENVSTDVDYRNVLADFCGTISPSDVSVEPADTDEVSDLCNHHNSHVHNYCVTEAKRGTLACCCHLDQ